MRAIASDTVSARKGSIRNSRAPACIDRRIRVESFVLEYAITVVAGWRLRIPSITRMACPISQSTSTMTASQARRPNSGRSARDGYASN